MTSQFERWWQAWPENGVAPFTEYLRKKNRKGCEAKWNLHKLDDKADVIIRDVELRKKYDRAWLNNKGAFLIGPLVYLNQEQWNDGKFADVRDEYKRKAASIPLPRPPNGPEQEFSHYACYANLYMLKALRKSGGVGPKLPAILAKKNEMVTLAEQEKWDQKDFISIITKTIDGAFA